MDVGSVHFGQSSSSSVLTSPVLREAFLYNPGKSLIHQGRLGWSYLFALALAWGEQKFVHVFFNQEKQCSALTA